MNKLDPKFIKDKMVEYVNKVAHHHYQHNANKETPGNRIMFVPFIKDDRCMMVIIEIGRTGNISLSSETYSHKRSFKEQLFHIHRPPYAVLTSVKRYKQYEEIVDKVKSVLEENREKLETVFNDYSGKRNLLTEISKQLND